MQKNISSARALIGFLVAPGVPALVWLLLNLNAPHGEGVLIFFLLAPFAYCAAVVLGIPAYIVLGRRSVQGLLAYVVFGAIIGALFAVAIQGIEIISNLSSAPEHAMALLSKSLRITLIVAIYGASASLVFWVIVIWRR